MDTQKQTPNDGEGDGGTTYPINEAPGTACIVRDQGMEGDKARSKVTFRYTVENVSKMKDPQLSPPYYVRNLPWKIKVMPRSSQTLEGYLQRSFGFFLECNSGSQSTSWRCYAVAELRLISCKKVQNPFSRKIQHLFNSKKNDWGFSHFMPWQDVLDPEQGYIKDDSITLEVHVEADAPCGVTELACTPRDQEMEGDKARSEVTFRYTVENVSKMKDPQLSPPCYVRNLPWKIKVMRRSSQTLKGYLQRSLGFFLECNSGSQSTSWSCNAVAELRLLSCKKVQNPFSRKIQHLFNSKENDWGFSHYIPWQDVLDPEQGFIEEDSITLEVHVEADASCGVTELACIPRDQEMETDKARSEVTFGYTVENVSKMKDPQLSPPCYVRNLPWKIKVMPTLSQTPEGQPQRSLGVFLECNNESESMSWRCYAVVDLSLIPCKKGQDPFRKKIRHLFNGQDNDCGFSQFITWTDVLDSQQGYIKHDCIRLEVHIVAYAPCCTPEIACIVPDQEMDKEETRSQATFRYTVKNVSKMKDPELSPAYYVRNLPWKIKVMPRSNQTQEGYSQRSLGFFLECNSGSQSTSWSCYAVAELRLISCKKVQNPFSRKIQHIFNSKENDRVFSDFMPWQDVLDPKQGHIKDDSITLEVHLVADVPRYVPLI